MFACIHIPDFAVQAALRTRTELRRNPVAVLDGEPPLETVFSVNPSARRAGAALGMGRLQAESFSGIHLLRRSKAEEQSAQEVLVECASLFSPRLETVSFQYSYEPGGTIVLDISGTESLFGRSDVLAKKLDVKLSSQALSAHITISTNFHASICAARGLSGVVVISPGKEAKILGPLPLDVLDMPAETAETFALWGIRCCSALGALPESELIARLGQQGKRLLALARGEHTHLLVPIETGLESELIESMELDHPVEFLEPLLFLFLRMLDQIIQRVRPHALAIASVNLKLILLCAANGEPRTDCRTIRPALPTQDIRTLLKLLQLELEMRPVHAAVLALEVSAIPARLKTAQHGLFVPSAPEPGQLQVLLARLGKLFGEDRVGTAQLLDTNRSDGFRMGTFTSTVVRASGSALRTPQVCPTVLRVCRPPLAIRVLLTGGKLATIVMEGELFVVEQQAGPWRKTGEWWSQKDWSREEWDVVLSDKRSSVTCLIAHDPSSGCWYLQGTYD